MSRIDSIHIIFMNISFAAAIPANQPGINHMKEVITYYFNCGYTYDTMIDFLKTHHGISMSLRTLNRRLKEYNLKRKNVTVDEANVRNLVRMEMANAGEQSGYRTIWHALRLIHNVHPPREMVARILRELDPAASHARRARRLTRRKYLSPGPNHCWHVDGKPICFFLIQGRKVCVGSQPFRNELVLKPYEMLYMNRHDVAIIY